MKNHSNRHTFWIVVTAMLVVAVATMAEPSRDGDYDDSDHRDARTYAIGLWGDLPYSDLQVVGVQNLIADMNRQGLAFSVHDGDLKQGKGLPVCADALYDNAKLMFNESLRSPAMFTPGDNDWVDCDRPENGSFNPINRLSYERLVFFGDEYSMGRHKLHQQVQSEVCLGAGSPDPADHSTYEEACSENRRWTYGRVTYATLNIQGSCNNLCSKVQTDEDDLEYAARNAANIEWMQETFADAKNRHSVAIMFISQADPGFSDSEFDAPNRDPLTLAQIGSDPDGFQEFLVALRDEVVAFGKPVTYVHGDSHYFRIDKPLLTETTGVRIQNFTRVETFGDHAKGDGESDFNNADAQWVKVFVDSGSREVFSYQPQIVPQNQ